MISSWIVNVIDPKPHTSVAYVETAHMMWENLQRRYVVAHAVKIHPLKTNLPDWTLWNFTPNSWECGVTWKIM